ncbi:MAG: OB-fold putative lipoprotein [Deltaproteobacteria bacterium]|jgi:hypothetical protein|nr:OB-fold putative lipoprotein [Deltaproteobacteria bacterium]
MPESGDWDRTDGSEWGNGSDEPRVDAEITALRLQDNYLANEARADFDYKDKILKVSGFVNRIGKNEFDETYFVNMKSDSLRDDDSRLFVKLNFRKGRERDIMHVGRGDIISPICTGGGMTQTVPVLNDCVDFGYVIHDIDFEVLAILQQFEGNFRDFLHTYYGTRVRISGKFQHDNSHSMAYIVLIDDSLPVKKVKLYMDREYSEFARHLDPGEMYSFICVIGLNPIPLNCSPDNRG